MGASELQTFLLGDLITKKQEPRTAYLQPRGGGGKGALSMEVRPAGSASIYPRFFAVIQGAQAFFTLVR